MSRPKFRFEILVVSLVLSSLAIGAARPQQGSSSSAFPSVLPQELVQRTVNNELKASDDGEYMFKDRRQTPSGSKTKMMIETKDGTVAYLIAINDQPLTAEQRQQDNERVQRLMSSPEEQNRKKKAQQADSDRVQKMFRELPQAFVFKYESVVPGKNGHQWVQLSFTPKSNYNPPSRETSVFKSMKGTMVIDPQHERIAKIEATLFQDVSFGWGILGHLDKGGHFIVEQTNIGGNRWEPTYMNIQFSGKALLFKTIDLRQIESTSDYVRVPDNLTLAQGVEMLRKRVDSVLADNGKGK